MCASLLFFMVTKMPGLGNLTEESSLGLSHHGCEGMGNECVPLDVYTGTLHQQLDRHSKRHLMQGQNMSLLMTYVHQ